MFWFKRFCQQQPLLGVAPQPDLDLSTFETFIASLKKLPKDQLEKLQKEMDTVKESSFKPSGTWKELYHGTPYGISQTIKDKGFLLGEGRRSGFMGSTKLVSNQGIFLSDNIGTARYFGENRSDSPNNSEVLKCYADVSRIMDFQNAPREIVKLGLLITNKYEGTKKTRLAIRDWWWLLDYPEFVSAIKKLGYSGVSFPESPSLRVSGKTYLIFDPSTIKIKGKKGDGINNVQDFYEYLRDKR